jgi:predicted CoA-binding protein
MESRIREDSSTKPSIAIIGASANRAKFGNKAVRAYAHAGYHVYPVNPNETTIEGWPVFSSLEEVPATELDRVSIYLPPSVGIDVLPQIVRKSVGEVWFNPGSDNDAVLARARELGLNAIAGCSIVDLGITPTEVDAIS